MLHRCDTNRYRGKNSHALPNTSPRSDRPVSVRLSVLLALLSQRYLLWPSLNLAPIPTRTRAAFHAIARIAYPGYVCIDTCRSKCHIDCVGLTITATSDIVWSPLPKRLREIFVLGARSHGRTKASFQYIFQWLSFPYTLLTSHQLTRICSYPRIKLHLQFIHSYLNSISMIIKAFYVVFMILNRLYYSNVVYVKELCTWQFTEVNLDQIIGQKDDRVE